MIEYFSEALVLAKEENGEIDGTIHLYTEKLGRVLAKAKSIKRIKSKLSAYLEPLNFVNVRLVGNGRLQIVDALASERNEISKIKNSSADLAKFLKIAEFIKEITFEFQADQQLWRTILCIFKESPQLEEAYALILRDLGFGPDFALCDICQKQSPDFFDKEDQGFICKSCVLKSNKNSLILIKRE